MSPEPRRVYFAFADGELSYDCVACGARCCRGLGFGATEAELATLLEDRPGLAVFARRGVSAGRSVIWNFEPACFFLEGERCVLHRERGFAAKPSTCRWFPANRLLVQGELLIVGLHSFCPVARRGGGVALSHAQLLSALREESGRLLTEPASLHLDVSSSRFVDHEEWCRDRLRGCTSVISLAGAMAAAASRLSEPGLDLGGLPVETGPREELATYADALRRFIGQGSDPSSASTTSELAPLLAALSPGFRLQLLEELGWLPYRALVEVYPRMLLGLELFLEVLAGVSRAPITSQTVREVLGRSGRLLWLLAHLDRVVGLRAEDLELKVKVSRSGLVELRRLLSFIHRENPRQRLTLAATLERLGFESTRSRIEVLSSLPDDVLRRLTFVG